MDETSGFDWGWERLRERLPELGLELLHWDERWRVAILRMTRREGPAIQLDLGPDSAGIRYGRLAIGLAGDEEDAREILVHLLAAIVAGRVWDRFGYGPHGSFDWIGSRVEYDGGAMGSGGSRDAREVLRIPA